MKRISNPYVKEALLALALDEAAAFEALPQCPPIVSPKLTQKIERLTRAQRRWTWNFVKTAKRRFVTVLTVLILLFALSLSISGVRETIFNFITSTFATHTNFEMNRSNQYQSTTYISKYYSPKWIPDNYKETNIIKISTSSSYIWQYGEQQLCFYQFLADSVSFNLDTEFADFDQQIINNTVTYVKEKNGTYDFWWVQDVYVFHLVCPTDIGWENAVKIIESVA